VLEVVYGGGDEVEAEVRPRHRRGVRVGNAGGVGADHHDLPGELVARALRVLALGDALHLVPDVDERDDRVQRRRPGEHDVGAVRNRIAQVARHARGHRRQPPAEHVDPDRVAAAHAVLVADEVDRAEAPDAPVERARQQDVGLRIGVRGRIETDVGRERLERHALCVAGRIAAHERDVDVRKVGEHRDARRSARARSGSANTMSKTIAAGFCAAT
jgi:hypothetical protein